MTWIASIGLVVAGAVAGLGAGFWHGQSTGYRDGRQAGVDATTAASATDALSQMGAVLSGANDLVSRSNAASDGLGRRIAEAGRINTKSTEELRNALKSTADSRITCRYDDSVMQHLEAARSRAASAAATGTSDSSTGEDGGALSGPTAAGQQSGR